LIARGLAPLIVIWEAREELTIISAPAEPMTIPASLISTGSKEIECPSIIGLSVPSINPADAGKGVNMWPMY
jgi:hypothetical protein